MSQFRYRAHDLHYSADCGSSVSSPDRIERRELVAALAAATTLSGCSALGDDSDDGSGETVNPALRSTPTRSEFDTVAESAVAERLTVTPSLLIGSEERSGGRLIGVYDPATLTELRTLRTGGRSVVTPDGVVVEQTPTATATYALPETDARWRDERRLRLLAFGDGLWFRVAGDGPETVLRLDTDEWQIVWEQSVGELVSWTDSHLLTHDGDGLVCREPDTGAVRWRTTLPDPVEPSLDTTSRRVGDAIAVVDGRRVDLLAAEAGTHRGRHTPDGQFAPRRTVGHDGTVVCGGPDAAMVGLDTTTGDLRWRVDEPATTPVAVGPVVYATGFDGGRVTTGVDRRNGTVRWRRPGAVGAVGGAGAHVIDGETLTAVGSSGTVQWRRRHGLSSVTTPGLGSPAGGVDGPPVTVRDGRVSFCTPEAVRVWAVPDGSERVRLDGLSVESAVLGPDGRLFLSTGSRLGVIDA